jgi:hypothetical protein
VLHEKGEGNTKPPVFLVSPGGVVKPPSGRFLSSQRQLIFKKRYFLI